MVTSVRAAGAIAVGRNFDSQGVRTEMGDLAKKIDGSFGVAALEFAIGGAHRAK